VFSFGIVLWELLTGEEPYADLHYGVIIGGYISSIADIYNAVGIFSNCYELELNVSCSFVCRWHCEQHSTAAGARLL
jgi:hypothetical protein